MRDFVPLPWFPPTWEETLRADGQYSALSHLRRGETGASILRRGECREARREAAAKLSVTPTTAHRVQAGQEDARA